MNFTELSREQMQAEFMGFPEHKLKDIVYAAGHARKEQYEISSGPPKYGNLPRIMTDEQLTAFFDAVRNPLIKQAFLLQFFYGLRIGELQTVRIGYYDESGCVMIGYPDQKTKAGKDTEFLPLIKGTELLFEGVELINDYSTAYLQKCFRAIRRDAEANGLSFQYGTAKNTGRPLYLKTPHSFRHTAINHVRKTTDELTSQMFARHSLSNAYGATATYFHKGFDELRADLSDSFADWINTLLE